MKKLSIIITFILSLVLIFLIYKYCINDDWNRTERIVFMILLVLGPVNSAILIRQNRKGGNIMNIKLYHIKNKIPELSYAFTSNGVELPVLDITHPLFISSIDVIKLKEMLRKSEKTAEKTAEKFNNMPFLIKKFLVKRSFIISELLQVNGKNEFLTGISTLMLKLGPGLIGRGRKRFLDRLSSKGIGGIVLRMRIRDICKCQAKAMITLLSKSPGNDICFINIAGGAASDSINTLFLIQQEKPELLKNRKIEINVLDIDTYGPAFTERCLTVLKAQDRRFISLDISFRHIHYDWNSTEKLERLLSERKEWLQICSSEGGLFEYCSDDVIIRNLNALYNNSGEDIIVTGSLLHDIKTVDAGIVATLKISTGIKPRFLGVEGLKSILNKNIWKLDSLIEGNPRYLIFTLKKS
jgi:hypothetical protein